MTTCETKRLLTELDDLDDRELLKLLDDETQRKLWQEFIDNHLDSEDRETAIRWLLKEVDSTAFIQRLGKSNDRFLASRDLRNKHSWEIEKNWTGKHV